VVFNSSTHSTSYIPAYLLYFLSRLAHTVPVWHPLAKATNFYGIDYSDYRCMVGVHLNNKRDKEEQYLFIINVIEMWLESRPANSYERISHLP